MNAYNFTPIHTLSPDVAARKAARRKVIERARELERESYKAFMRKKRQLQARNDLATIA
jgi:hypothetical protein